MLVASAGAPTAGILVGVFGLVGVASTVVSAAVSVVCDSRRLRFMAAEEESFLQEIRLAFFSAALSEEHRNQLDWLAWHAHLLRNPARSYRRALYNRIASTQGQTGNEGSYFGTLRALPRLLGISPALRLAPQPACSGFMLSISFGSTFQKRSLKRPTV